MNLYKLGECNVTELPAELYLFHLFILACINSDVRVSNGRVNVNGQQGRGVSCKHGQGKLVSPLSSCPPQSSLLFRVIDIGMVALMFSTKKYHLNRYQSGVINYWDSRVLNNWLLISS